MTAIDTETMTALQELLNERQRYEGWLAALEQRKSNTPPHVYERVRTDYTQRLDEVLKRLSARTEQLLATVDVLTSRLDALRTKESERTDIRQEAELRAAVGEYADEEWTRLRSDADRELAEIAEERHSVENELSEIQRIIDSSQPPEQEASPAAAQRLESDHGNGANTAPSTPSTASENRLSLNDFVADWPAKSSEATAPSPKATPKAATAQGDGTPRAPEVGTTDKATIPPRHIPPPPIAGGASDHRRDNEKTLKCPECGTMNYATEWYCERCGGELATF